MRLLGSLLLLCAATLASGCATFLPAAAPTSSDLESPREENWDFYLVPVNANIIHVLSKYREDGLPASFSGLSYQPKVVLRAGDVVAVSVYETGGSTLFGAPQGATIGGVQTPAPAPGATTIPGQVIEPSGKILVPFVGQVSVAGLTPSGAAKKIEDLLAAKAVQPQVVVSVVNNVTNTAVVSGEANKTGPVPLTLRGERLLDVIAAAGGARYPVADIDVELIRGKVVGTITMQRLISDPSQNVVIRPNDQVVLIRNPKSFTVLGAS